MSSERAASLDAEAGLAWRATADGGETVLWLHGYTLDSSIWDEVWAHLPQHRHVAVDLPGHGASEQLCPDETLPQLARRLVAFARERNVEHLAAVSFGGLIALQMAIEAPGAFATMTLSSPAVGGGPTDLDARARNRQLMRVHAERGAGPWLTDLWMTSPPDIFTAAAAHPELWSVLRAAVDRHGWGELADAGLRTLTAHDQVRHLSGIDASVLVLVGDHDMPAFQRTAELLRRRIPRCSRVYCPDAGHLSLLEVPERLAPLVDAHVRSAPLNRRAR